MTPRRERDHRAPWHLRRVLIAAGTAGTVLCLAACGLEQPSAGAEAAASQTAAAGAGSAGTTLQVAGAMDIIDAVIPAPPAGSATALVEMTLASTDAAGPDVLSAASSPAARAITFTVSGKPVPRIVIPVAAGSSVTTGPPHPDRILLTGLRHRLRTGQTVSISLTFTHAGRATIQVPVVPPAS